MSFLWGSVVACVVGVSAGCDAGCDAGVDGVTEGVDDANVADCAARADAVGAAATGSGAAGVMFDGGAAGSVTAFL